MGCFRPTLADGPIPRQLRSVHRLAHRATDSPGHFPNAAEGVGTLVAAGADVDGRGGGSITATPLHWAASSNDVEALDALLDAGADIDARGAVIAGGSPLEDAVPFGQWDAARRLVERGATVEFRQAAALGLVDVVARQARAATPDDLSMAFGYACHGGRHAAAELLLDGGADVNWIAARQAVTPLDAALRSDASGLAEWLRGRGGRTAAELGRAG